MSASDADSRRMALLTQIRAVPPGQVASYGAIARRAGFPRNARMVARLLASGDVEDLPWHRILRADGRIAFAPGSPEFDEQCARLRAEGVEPTPISTTPLAPSAAASRLSRATAASVWPWVPKPTALDDSSWAISIEPAGGVV